MGWEDRAYHRDGPSGEGPRLVFPMPTKLTFALILSCLLVFILQVLTASHAVRSPLTEWGALDFSHGRAFTQPWRWITYQYLHGNGSHIFWNMLAVYFFVPPLERLWGWKRTLAFYTGGGIAAGITYGLMCSFMKISGGGLIGASGCIFAVLGALAAIVPDMQVMLLIIPLTMRTLALLYAVFYTLTVFADKNLSDAAHLGGLAFGWLLPRYASAWWAHTARQFQHRRVRRNVNAERTEQEMVDRILQKVHEHGMNSLSWSERRMLKKATEHQRQRDLELARSRKIY